MTPNPNSSEHKFVTQTDRGGLPGFSGIRHKGTNAAKQIQGSEGPSKRGSSSSPEGLAPNASFDHSPYQDLISSMRGLPLTDAPVGSEDGNKYTRGPSNRSHENNVGSGRSNVAEAHKPYAKVGRQGSTVLRQTSDGSSYGG